MTGVVYLIMIIITLVSQYVNELISSSVNELMRE